MTTRECQKRVIFLFSSSSSSFGHCRMVWLKKGILHMMRARLYPFPAKGLMRINEITSCSIIKNDDDCFKKLIKYLFFLWLWHFSAAFFWDGMDVDCLCGCFWNVSSIGWKGFWYFKWSLMTYSSLDKRRVIWVWLLGLHGVPYPYLEHRVYPTYPE